MFAVTSMSKHVAIYVMFIWYRYAVQWHGRGGKFPTVCWIVAQNLMASSVIWMSVLKKPLIAIEMWLWW